MQFKIVLYIPDIPGGVQLTQLRDYFQMLAS